ncbi:hypothetical protein ACS0TY_011488 [Phlomoides rotata]
MSKYEYPRLPRNEIIMVLAESKIATVSEADLLRPDPEEDQGQMEFGALEQLENPDSHTHSIPVMNLFNKLRQLLAAVGCPKPFTPKDLIKPDAERTELFLGALLNFHLHRQMKLDRVKPIGDDLNLFEEKQIEAEARISQLNSEIAEFEELREKELPQVKEINSKVEELSQTVAGLNKHQVNLKSSHKQLREQVKEIDEKISNAEFALVQSVQENASLRSKIVQSPDKLQRALEERKLVKNEAKNAERASMQTSQDKSATVEAYAKAYKKASKHYAQIQAVQEQATSAKSVDKDVKVLKSKMSDEEVMIKSHEAKLVELQSKADQLKELQRQAEKERATLHEAANKELNNVKLEVESKKQALELRQRQVESVVAEAEALTLKKKTVREDGEAKMQELEHKSEEVLAATLIDGACGDL